VPRRRAAAVVRFSSLGDVLLAAHVPVFLKRKDPARPVLFVTKERYAGLLGGHPHVDRVYALREGGGGPAAPGKVSGSLGDLVAAMREDGVGEIVDLHRNWRSSRVRAALSGVKSLLAPKYALRRRLWVYARWLHPQPVPPLLRTYRELAGLDPLSELTPWLRGALSDTERALGRERLGSEALARGFILLGAGARWGTKRWPAAHFVRLAERIERERGHRARFALLPGEPLAPEIERHLAARGEEPLSLPFRELAALASHATAIVSNDSAVLHLGPALGVPAVGLFGGTVPEFGFARQGPRDEVAEIQLGCRPCGVHGRARCPLGHHACMRDLSPDVAYAALSRALDGLQAAQAPSAAAPAPGRAARLGA
jgi:heptosyltransferase-2